MTTYNLVFWVILLSNVGACLCAVLSLKTRRSSQPSSDTDVILSSMTEFQRQEAILQPTITTEILSHRKEEAGESVVKPGSPLEFDEEELGIGEGIFRIVVESGGALPSWTRNETPLKIETEGQKIVFWFRHTKGLHRIH